MRKNSGPSSRFGSSSQRPARGGSAAPSGRGSPAPGGRGPKPAAGRRPENRRPDASGTRPANLLGTKPKDFINVPKAGRMIMGEHAIREAFKKNPKALETLVLQDNWKDNESLRELEQMGREKRLKIELRSAQTMDRMGSHQGALLIANTSPSIEISDLLGLEEGMIVALDGVEDPHNLGAVLRTCWLMGVKAVIIPEDRAVGLTPVAHKVAAGGAEHVPLIRDNNFQSVFSELKEAGYWIFGLSHRAKGLIYDLSVPKKVVWVLGAEDKGLRSSTEKICDELVRLPQLEAGASYNVSVATAMTLSESQRQTLVASRPPGKNSAPKT